MKAIDEKFMGLVAEALGPERRTIGDEELKGAWEKVRVRLEEGSPMCKDAADREKDSSEQSDRKEEETE